MSCMLALHAEIRAGQAVHRICELIVLFVVEVGWEMRLPGIENKGI